MKNKGFTLIELLAVLVVLAILALISVPITIRIINNARENSYKRSIASYGKTFEKVIAMKSMENSGDNYGLLKDYVSDVEKNYSGNRVECDFSFTSNSDENYSTLINGRLILRGCRINNQNITYKYENGNVTKIEYDYKIGDTFTLNGDSYHVITDSLTSDDYVTALRDIPLSSNELNTYGVGHLNRYSGNFVGTAYDSDGYGGMAYYTSETCGYVNNSWIYSGCTNDYSLSDVKYVIDNWADDKLNGLLKEVKNYKARLLNTDELIKFGFNPSNGCYSSDKKMPWISGSYWYWTMSSSNVSSPKIWTMSNKLGDFPSICNHIDIIQPFGRVRPVINVYKSAIES